MRIILIAAAFWCALTVGSFAQSREIETTIGGQIEAFLVDDFETAFTFASPSIQGIFGTPENFGRMVREGYPMVWRPAEVQYLELRDIGGALWQRILIRDTAGAAHLLDYQMIETENGWKINGVQYIAPPDVNA
ncbi:DUF4864 domain-containing protein [Falsiphaeobacter marinintestinus]|uniref:DUF4864 domain-containing protein n=1 Tax=Falsiphaeobacter marinintestinus TaxID=1492905 RepID=UPI0011B52E1B|nr:DUF4864 domain-containing protein [Phaeobacter marinintestinus]